MRLYSSQYKIGRGTRKKVHTILAEQHSQATGRSIVFNFCQITTMNAVDYNNHTNQLDVEKDATNRAKYDANFK